MALLTFGQNPRTVVWGPNSGLQDETLGRVFDLLTGDDGVLFEENVVLPLTEANCDYARSIFRELVERHGLSQRIPRLASRGAKTPGLSHGDAAPPRCLCSPTSRPQGRRTGTLVAVASAHDRIGYDQASALVRRLSAQASPFGEWSMV